MPLPHRGGGLSAQRFPLLTALLLAAAVGSLGAQTLHQRPESEPMAPAETAAARPETAVRLALAAGTSLQVETAKRYGMKRGETIEARLMHPLYVHDQLVVAQGTLVRGRVVELEPNRNERLMGRLNGDFTPFDTPVVQFDELVLPGGTLKMDAETATDGAPVLNLRTPHAMKHRSLVAREWDAAKQRVRDQIRYFTPPGLKLRMLSLLYHQLPYHPQWIPEHTAWSFELATPVKLPDDAAETAMGSSATAATGTKQAINAQARNANGPDAKGPDANGPELWQVHALLEGGLSSATAKSGDAVKAMVVEPVYDSEKRLVVPEGAELVGRVTQSKAARSLGRNGKLRFSFVEMKFPAGRRQAVQGELAGAATNLTEDLKLDAEGTVTPRSRGSAIAPLLLTVLAVKGLDTDGNLTAQTTAASNGFGLVGRVVGIAAGNRSVAAGLGMYAAALSFGNNFLRHGRDVIFPKDTRIEIETTPLRATVLKPAGQ